MKMLLQRLKLFFPDSAVQLQHPTSPHALTSLPHLPTTRPYFPTGRSPGRPPSHTLLQSTMARNTHPESKYKPLTPQQAPPRPFKMT